MAMALAASEPRTFEEKIPMTDRENIRLLFVDPDRSNCRAAELYLDSYNPRDVDIKVASSLEELRAVADGQWDAIFLSREISEEKRADWKQKIQEIIQHVPVIELGGEVGVITTEDKGGADFLPQAAVDLGALMRSTNHVLAAKRLGHQVSQLRERFDDSSRTDPLSGLWNRTYLMERIAEEIMSWQRYHTPLSICLFGITEFDTMNEKYGFDVRDDVLGMVGNVLHRQMRGTDFGGRLGNDIFCLIFPKTPVSSARICVDRLHEPLKRTIFSEKDHTNFTVEAYFSIVQLGAGHKTPNDLLECAQEGLAKAKISGAGSVEIVESAPHVEGPSVLIVDDHSSILDFCCDVFQEEGYAPTAAKSSEEALRAMANNEFDLYVLSPDLPEGDGMELLRKVASRHPGQPPIIVIRGEREWPIEDVPSLGPDHVLRKPFAPSDITDYAKKFAKRPIKKAA